MNLDTFLNTLFNFLYPWTTAYLRLGIRYHDSKCPSIRVKILQTNKFLEVLRPLVGPPIHFRHL